MFFVVIFLLQIGFVTSNEFIQCPSSLRQCFCSKDLKIISCANRQINDRTFVDFVREIPRETIVLNLSSNSLTSISILPSLIQLETLDLSRNQLQTLPSNLFIKFPQLSSLFVQSNFLRTIPKSFNEISNLNLDLSLNPLNCQCSMKWIVKWFETLKFVQPISCQRSTKLTEEDFCSSQREFLDISPEQSQIVYENDSLTLNCSSNSKVFWTFNNEFVSSNSIVDFQRLKVNDSGRWTCHNSYRNRSIDLHVLKIRSQHFCPSIRLESSKGEFSWPRTLTGQTIRLKCPFGGAAWTNELISNVNAFYTCSIHRQWIDLDLSQCAFRTNISREFDRIVSKNETNLLAKLVQFVSQTNFDEFQVDDVIFLIDLIDEENEKYRLNRKTIDEISTFIFRLTDSILQLERNFLVVSQYEKALIRLRFIVEDLFRSSNRSWFYVGKQLTAMTLESPTSPAACFVPQRPLLTIICGILNRQTKRHESRLATIEFPSASIYRILLYRQTKLFQLESKSQFIDHPVISIERISSTNVSNVKLTFYSQTSQTTIGSWNSNESSWNFKPSFCRISQQNIDLIETDCSIETNRSVILTYWSTNFDQRSLFLNENYLELAVVVSSIIGSICFFLSIFFYICYHKVYLMPRSFFHCLINYWFCLGILFPLFAFGIRQSDFLLVCQLVSVTLHYLCLSTIIWLTLLSYCIWQKLYMIWSGKGHSDDDDGQPAGKSVMIVDYDDDGLPIMKIKTKPVIQFYFLAYGISFIICGINVAISREQYISNKICFLNNFESLLTVVIPIGVFTFLSLIFLIAARLNISRLRKEAIRLRNLPDEDENENENENVQQDETKPNETLPIIYPSTPETMFSPQDCRQSHLDSLCSSDMDHQHDPSNQLVAILFQNFLLIAIFLSTLSIYFHPFRSFSFRFEHSIYSHLYGLFVLLLSFFVLAFYVLSRADFTLHCKYTNFCSNRSKKKRRLLDQSFNEPPPPPQTPQQSPTPKVLLNPNSNTDESFSEQIAAPSPPQSIRSSTIYNCQTAGQNNVVDRGQFGSKYQAQLASKYYAKHRHLLKTNASASETSLPANDVVSLSNLKLIESSEETKMIQPIPIETSRVVISPRTFVRPATSIRPEFSPSQAIIRPLPIVRLSSPLVEQRQPTIVYLNKNSNLIQQEEIRSTENEEHPHARVAFIDEDEEGSVSLKSSTTSRSSSTTTTPSVARKDRSKSLSSSSSSSSTFSQDFQRESIETPNELVLHESSV